MIKKIVRWLNRYQQSHSPLNVIYAVLKKSGDDQVSYQAALITYYGFLSLFPLLIVMTSVLQLTLKRDVGLQHRVIAGIAHYFPAMSTELEANIHGLHRTGLALVAGILITLYGSLGVAGAWMNTLNHIWLVPRRRRLSQPRSTLQALKLMVVGGIGLLLAAILSSLAASLGHSQLFRFAAILVSTVVLFATLLYVFKAGTVSKIVSIKSVWKTAITSAIVLQIIESLGGYVMTHELKNFSPLYGAFAVALGLIFWIYLQIQAVLWILEVVVVRQLRLYPRSIDSRAQTPQDQKAYDLYALRDRLP